MQLKAAAIMTDTPNTPELNPQDVQDEDDLDVVVMTDEDGTEYLYDIAARMEHGDNEYVVLVPQDENDDEVVILRSEIVDDETEEFVPEEDDSITDAIFEEFKQMFADDYNFADGDEGDDSMFTDAE